MKRDAGKFMLKRVHQTVVRRALIRPGMHVIAGVSGGADSMAMLYALWFLRQRMEFQLTVAHLNHGLRGRSAQKDADFVHACCVKLSVPVVIDTTNVAQARDKPGQSIEMAAREARHNFFIRILNEQHGDVVALAHHQDDQAETVLMRLLGGSGMTGLGGMDYQSTPKPGLKVIRPMLDVSRQDIERFLTRHRIPWRNDATNRDSIFRRNKVRHSIIPFLIEQGFEGVVPALNRLADIMREEAKVLDRQSEEMLRVCRRGQPKDTLSRAKLMHLSVAGQRRVIYLWMTECGVGERSLGYTTIEKVRHILNAGGQVTIARGQIVESDGKTLRLRSKENKNASGWTGSVKLRMPGSTRVQEMNLAVAITSTTGYKPSVAKVGQLPCDAYICRKEVTPNLHLRTRRPGDRIHPTGMKGSIALKDLFINAKIPAERRLLVPVLECGGEVVWVAGFRVSRNWAVPSAHAPSWRIRIIPMRSRVSEARN